MKRALLLIAVAIGLGSTVAIASIDRWLFDVLDPGRFDATATPPRPDYVDPAAWAALPGVDDAADVFVPELPARDRRSAPADVFYVHPTTWVGAEWNGPIDDPRVIEGTARGATLIQASAFNACCAIDAPRYRQANGNAFSRPSPDGDRALDGAYGDVQDAFAILLEHNSGRPFIVASHSQGTLLAARLLREEIRGRPVATRMVAACLIGGPIYPETAGTEVPVCAEATQTGCVIAWNARGPHYVVNALEFADSDVPEGADPMSRRICVNPLTWAHDDKAASADANAGALFFDAPTPTVVPGFADAACQNGRLVVREIGKPPRDFMSRVLDWMMGPENYHPIEYQLYYVNIRQNALARVEAFGRAATPR